MALLIEREDALEALRTSVDAVRAGHGQVVVIDGEAGIGKTTLLRQFSLSGQGVRMIWGKSDALSTPRPLGPLHDMATALGPLIAELLDDAAPQNKLFPALLRVLETARDPLVLIFEDVHWSDDATLDLVKYLGRRVGFMRAGLFLTNRSDEMRADHPLAQVLGDLPAESTRRIHLAPLSLEGVRAMAGKGVGDIENFYQISAGNPFFVTELMAAGAEAAQNIPKSVRDAVWARLQRLDRAEVELLETISIMPGGAEEWLADALHGRSSSTVIDSCVSRGLLGRDADRRFRFRHELARVATLERLSSTAQRNLHRRAFQQLSGRTDVPLSSLVHHAAGCGR